MMGLFPQQFIDDLRLQANILQVVQEYVPLKRAGDVYKGTARSTPRRRRRSTSSRQGFFHCFGCGVGGDVFKFLELHEKVGFQDAVRMLAQKFGVALPEKRGTATSAARCGAARRRC
jgi:DNA primase